MPKRLQQQYDDQNPPSFSSIRRNKYPTNTTSTTTDIDDDIYPTEAITDLFQ